MNQNRIQQLLGAATGCKLLVIGDVMLDEFVWGRVSRISPEAPVPVVEVVSESCYPGGAANVARNLVEFTPSVEVLGMIGKDVHGSRLRELLRDERIGTDRMIETDAMPTIVKTRIIARQQQVVRVDRERRFVGDDATKSEILRRVSEALPTLDAIIFEDYGKGLITQTLKDEVVSLCAGRDVIITVDPNPNNPLDWSGVTAIKPNRSEAFASAGVPATEPADNPLYDKPLLAVGEVLLDRWNVDNLLITLGEHGMLLLERGGEPHHIPTRAREVFDVSGAGDTAIAIFTLALTAGATAKEAAELSNLASGIVVGKLGTATITAPELLAAGYPEVQ
ncbi:MAG: bifunctional heptose 7-phosphate kinase/heptose 1-phosphate adenyltransferase [Chthoniobacterales bacterium]